MPKPNREKTIEIPELEEAAKCYSPKFVWTPEKESVARKYWDKVQRTDLAKYIGCDRSTLLDKLKKMGLV